MPHRTDESFIVRPMALADVSGVVALQKACFPPPFPQDYHWLEGHIRAHLTVFPEGQFVAERAGLVIGSASNLIVSEEGWESHADWMETTGGTEFQNHDPQGSTLYGADISVHPETRGQGVGRALYQARFNLVKANGLRRFGTACRIPDWREWSVANRDTLKQAYCLAVVRGDARDRTLTPLLRMGMAYRGVIEDYMDDDESGNAAALLEWNP
ncbi:MAG: GNAT family N-acetyltransferase [Fimbriimonadaceae bacterium]|nr:GNAT family N-acetyltransferase [Fimbriimonadaceae bacterium]QYK54922.1 MAG: GNAT family N-acetyltransferase [Fimbriimonadaceae bacterium]